jgi:hypothetical protein
MIMEEIVVDPFAEATNRTGEGTVHPSPGVLMLTPAKLRVVIKSTAANSVNFFKTGTPSVSSR